MGLTNEGDLRRAHWSACRRPWTLLYVTVLGNALPCCIAPWITGYWVLLTMPQLCFAFSAAGRVWGLDALLRPWLARMPPTGWSRVLLLAR
jgi:hypothetical protein